MKKIAAWLLIPSLIIVCYLLFFYKPCIHSGSGDKIQRALNSEGSKAILCQKAVFLLNKPIIFTHINQQLFTQDLPTQSDKKAVLKIINNKFSVAVNGYNQNGIIIKNIRVDGNRRELGQLKSHGLVLIGGNVDNQEIDHAEVFDSRSWTTVHVNWGKLYTDKKNERHSSCQNVKVTNNIIYDSGEVTDGKWSDGISVQCEKSLIADNVITDVTDGGIVIFGAPNSKIVNNKIRSVNKTMIVGIAMVDYKDYRGNYNEVDVSNNEIISENSYIKIGIAMGSRTWTCPGENFGVINQGAIIKNNIIKGKNFGYGYVIDGVSNWTFQDNRSEASFKGTPGKGCGFAVASPTSFLIDKKYSQGNFQSGFKEGRAEKIYDIKP